MKLITVIGDRVAVDVTPVGKSEAGLIIPEFAKTAAEQGIVIKCGPDVRSSALVPGVRVVFGRFAGTVFKLDFQQIKVVREEDIMLVVGPYQSEEISDGKRHTD